jgi:hypothetical protein
VIHRGGQRLLRRRLEEQFEFIQSKWCNDPNFPVGPTQQVSGYQPTEQPADGPDPIIGQRHGQGQDDLKTPQGGHQLVLQQFTRVKGGEYFITPTIAALKALDDRRWHSGMTRRLAIAP